MTRLNDDNFEVRHGQIKPLPTDVILIIRNGEVHLVAPHHEAGQNVSLDFLAAFGMANCYTTDPDFRIEMMKVASAEIVAGKTAGFIGDSDERAN